MTYVYMLDGSKETIPLFAERAANFGQTDGRVQYHRNSLFSAGILYSLDKCMYALREKCALCDILYIYMYILCIFIFFL